MRFKLLVILLILVSGRSLGQGNQPSNSNGILPNVIPGSSEAASLGKYGEWPVSEYTGVPNISIPLYTIKINNFELPVQLSYHAGGIKVDEVSSWAGVGWALNAGGAISRTIVGLADDWAGGLSVENNQAGGHFLKGSYNLSDTNDYVFFRRVADQLADSEPDIYYLNIAGLSAKFCVDSLGNFHSIPASNIKILSSPFTSIAGGTGSLTQWIIADDKGNIYYFGSNTPNPQGTGYYGVESSYSGAFPAKIQLTPTTAWYITQIVTANRADTIYFDYTQKAEEYLFPSVVSYKALTNATALPTVLSPGAWAQYLNANETLYNGSATINYNGNISETFGYTTLARIRWRGGMVSFVSNTPRQDMYNSAGSSNMLDSVNVYTTSGTIFKTFSLKYSYVNQRYFLDSLSESGQAGPPKLAHTFGYISRDQLPAKGSFNQDHWGFNNCGGNTTLLPYNAQMPSISSNSLSANREPDPNSTMCMAMGTLNRINYPTGGYTLFNYEPNRYTSSSIVGVGTPPAPIVTTGAVVQGDTTSPYARAITFTVPFGQNNASISISFYNYGYSGLGANMTPLPYVALFPLGQSVAYAKQNYMYWNGYDNFPTTTITPNPNGLYNYTLTVNNLSLTPGTYVLVTSDSCLKVITSCPMNITYPYASVHLTYSAYGTAPPGGGPAPLPIAGGLRVKQIANYNTDGSFINAKQYTYVSGKLLMYPQYVTHIQQDVTNEANNASTEPDGGGIYCSPIEADIMEETSTSQTVLGLTQGAPVGYTEVIEKDTDNVGNDIGYIDYTFSFFSDSLNVFNFDMTYSPWANTTILNPLNPVNSFEYKRGLLLKKDIYKRNTDASYTKIKSQVNNYNFNDYNAANYFGHIRGLRLQRLRFVDQYSCGPSYGGYSLPSGGAPFSPDFGYAFYNITTSWIQHTSTTETNYDQNGQNPVVSSTQYYYDNAVHMNPTRIQTNKSNGSSVISLMSYPQDYASGTPFIDSLITHHIISIPIETVKYQQDLSNNITILSGNISTFKPDGKGLNDVVSMEASASPVALSGFKFSNVPSAGLWPYNTVSKSLFSPDPTYINRLSFVNYDQFGNILQDTKVSDVNHSYLWDYHSIYPIAEAVNAAQSDIAYTSFEADGTGNWTIPDTTRNRTLFITGNNSYNLNSGNIITKTGLNSSTTYIISYWSSGGSLNVNGTTATAKNSIGSWTYYEHMLTGSTSVSVSGSATIDELRLFPKSAQMTTYTYSPLIGRTGQCSPTNYITYYTYDGLGRLKAIKDMRGNIIKTFDYNYQGQ